MILHIPHSSVKIPDQFRNHIVLSDVELAAELLLMTDMFTEEIYSLPEAIAIRFPISRLIVDVERLPDDTEEPMNKVGMGIVYNQTAYGKKLKRVLQPQEISDLVSKYYKTHHQRLLNEVKTELEKYDKALIIDCHSFPSHPLPCDMDQSFPRPQFCIGTDPFHTPIELKQMIEISIKKMGYDVRINQPYKGTLIPMEFYRKDPRVTSIMIEINRRLYMDETTGMKKNTFESIKKKMEKVLFSCKKFQQIIPADS